MATMETRKTPRAPLLPPPPPPHPPLLVGEGRVSRQGAILGLVGLGIGPGLGMVGALGIVCPPLGRTQLTMTITSTIFIGIFGGGNYPMSLPNFLYLNPPHPQVQILTSSLTPTIHGMKVLCVPTHQINALLQAKCGGLRVQYVGLHLNAQSSVTKITRTYELLRLKVDMRAWSETRPLRCRRTIRIIFHCVLLLN